MQAIAFTDERVAMTGAFDFDRTDTGITPRRLPAWTRPQIPVFMEMMVTQPSGVRIEFTSDAEAVEVEVLLTRVQLADREPRRAVFDLVADGELVASRELAEGNVLKVDLRRPGQPELVPGEPSRLRFEGLPPGMKQCQLWLPTSAKVELRELGLNEGATLQACAPPSGPRWVHYGSSISHCAEAISPTRTWPATAARLAGANLTNLAFGGNCQLDQFVARTIRDLDADLISLKLGINIVNMDSMRERTFTPSVHGFLDTVRERHPDTPILVISPIFCPAAETSPGPTLPDADGKFVTFPGNEALRAGCLTLTWIRKLLTRVVAQRRDAGDVNLHYLDGLTLFGPDDAEDLPDDLHPNGDGYLAMGQRFYEQAFGDEGAFAQ